MTTETNPAMPERCPHCSALMAAVGTHTMGGMLFCQGCKRAIKQTAQLDPRRQAPDGGRDVKPL